MINSNPEKDILYGWCVNCFYRLDNTKSKIENPKYRVQEIKKILNLEKIDERIDEKKGKKLDKLA